MERHCKLDDYSLDKSSDLPHNHLVSDLITSFSLAYRQILQPAIASECLVLSKQAASVSESAGSVASQAFRS
jgi:hypothetical protein